LVWEKLAPSDFNLNIWELVADLFGQSRNWRPAPIDPLALDLDGDGLETVGIDGYNTIRFDHDGDGVKTGTGWVKSDDAFLALDKNGNDAIDSGRELFGVDTVLANGQTAESGCAALTDLDSYGDGQIDAQDAQFEQLRVWRDLDQDGVSDEGELMSLADAGIASIGLDNTATYENLPGGNVLSAQGSYTRADGTSGTTGEFTTGNVGNLDLTENPFYSEFTDPIELTDAAKALPGMHGSGMVRDLREAASLDGQIAADIESLTGTTRAQMRDTLDTLIGRWAGTSTMKTSFQLADDNDYTLVLLPEGMGVTDYLATQGYFPIGGGGSGGGSSGGSSSTFGGENLEERLERLEQEQEHLTWLIEVLERFNGQTFVDVEETHVTTGAGTRLDGGAGDDLLNGGGLQHPARRREQRHADHQPRQRHHRIQRRRRTRPLRHGRAAATPSRSATTSPTSTARPVRSRTWA
jgi:hypothetical protein